MPQRLLSVEEVAAYLHLSIHQVRRKLQSGTIRGVKVGHLWRVSPRDLPRYPVDEADDSEQPDRIE